MKLVYFGSGAFGLPTLKRLVRSHEVVAVVTQPDKRAGRKRRLTPTPIAQFAQAKSAVVKPQSVNEPDVVADLRGLNPDALVVIAYGQKLGRGLLDGVFAINLHGSLLPRYRGAAPVNWAMINGEQSSGLSVITLADRMDAGDILGQVETPIDPHETAGELHDRLAELGPDLVTEVLRRFEADELTHQVQDESLATRAPKLRKTDGTVSFGQPAEGVRASIHGLTPWPGCRVTTEAGDLRLLRAKVVRGSEMPDQLPGTITIDGLVACQPGFIQLLSVQPPGGKAMTLTAYQQGHVLAPGDILRPFEMSDP